MIAKAFAAADEAIAKSEPEPPTVDIAFEQLNDFSSMKLTMDFKNMIGCFQGELIMKTITGTTMVIPTGRMRILKPDHHIETTFSTVFTSGELRLETYSPTGDEFFQPESFTYPVRINLHPEWNGHPVDVGPAFSPVLEGGMN